VTTATQPETTPPADELRLVPFAPGWHLWPLGVLRSAGLPAERVLDLAAPESGNGEVSPAIERFVLDPWVREAITWQSRTLLESWLAAFMERLRAGDRSLHRRPRREATIALYAQRYTTKNDTIGFFGPVSWFRVQPEQASGIGFGEPLELRRGTYFESWAIEALARRWESDPELRPHLRPARDPSALLDGRRLLFPRKPPVDLTEEEAAVLELCDGTVPAAELLERLRQTHPGLGFESAAEVASVLSRLARRGCVAWRFDLPLDERMDEHLHGQLAAIPDPELRRRYVEPLERLRSRRDAANAAAGDPDRVLAALRELEATYAELVDGPAFQTKSEAATGRALVWHDVLTTRSVSVGEAPLARLAPVLGLVLDACRWLTWEVARGVEATAAAIVRAAPQGSVPFGRLLAELAPELRGEPGLTLDRVRWTMQTKATGILEPERAEAGRLDLRLDEVADRWRSEFAAPAPGWAAASLHSPDLLLAAADADAVERGDFLWVLGEVHVAVNTLENRTFVLHEEQPGAVAELLARSLPPIRYVPAFPRTWPDIGPRTYPPLAIDLPDSYLYWALEAEDTLPRDVPRRPTADLDVVLDERDGRPLVASTVDPGFRVELTEFVGELLSFLVGHAFRLVPELPHMPRISVDGVVLERESWAVAPARLARAVSAGAAPEALARVLREQHVPRFTFVHVPGQQKPLFCDTQNPPLLRALARHLRGAVDVGEPARFVEMLPGFGELWLRDLDGAAHTSEFRFVAVDRR
jgi:hypothetical protein